MIQNDQELHAAIDRISRLQSQVSHLRRVESNPANYHSSAAGFIAEIDRMQLKIRDYLSMHPTELATVL